MESYELLSIESISFNPELSTAATNYLTFMVEINKGSFNTSLVTVDIDDVGIFHLTRVSSSSTQETYQYSWAIPTGGTYSCTFFITDSNGRTINYTKDIIFTIEQIKLSLGFESPLLFLSMVCCVVYIKKSGRE